MKVLDNQLFDEVLEQAKASPRLRMNYDLRTQAEVPGWTDGSQRMLNVLEVGTVIPIHRHRETSETVIVVRGKVKEVLFDEQGREIDSCVLEYGGPCPGVQVPKGVYHTCVCLEPGSVIFEAKDRPYDPVGTEEMLGV
ncbi:MAG: WbuC family cupin fold metalloprotein [Bacteroidales bacterium]|nr:WbuC family cupin fold metalloprotein [Bacteroidales bacterium]